MKLYKQALLAFILNIAFGLCTADAQTSQKYIDPANMNMSIHPGDDFYNYAGAVWMKNNPVPAKETRWGSFNILRDFNINAVRTTIEKAVANKTAPKGSATRRVADFYTAGMDSMRIEQRGFTPIVPELKKIDAIKNVSELLQNISRLRVTGATAPLYGFSVGQDRKNVELMIPQFSQGGTTLPDRDYYLKTEGRNAAIQKAYKAYVSKMFVLIGNKEATANANAETLFALEKELAEAQKSRVEMRDPYKTYNKFHVTDLSATTPGMDWKNILTSLEVKGEDSVLVNNPNYFSQVAKLLQTVPLNSWKIYLQWNVLKSAAPYLSNDFVETNFAFNQVLTGQKEQTPRWQRISSLTDGSISDLLGQLYVVDYFKPEAKVRMADLVKNVRLAFANRIKTLDWMSDVTKEKALAKLAAFTPKIGYPDTWKNYEGLEIKPTTYFENVRNVGAWNYADMVDKLGKPVDRTRFGMTAPTVNAYYNATLNEIVFPAGILQFPFFDANADDAINYGGIGAVIGHEMSHGFDDNGSQYDADGTLRNWWTEADRKKFDAKAQALVKQFNGYTVQDSLFVNGKLTLGENIGDLGGLNVAYEAFKMTKQGKSNEMIDGFTPDQRFFLAWAQIWRNTILPQTAAQLLLTDTHSPGPYRTIGAPVNMEAWYNAFDVKLGHKLYKKPEDRILIW
jgi:putative endopeptidase